MPDSIRKKLGSDVILKSNERLEGYQYWQLQDIHWGNFENLISNGPYVKTKWSQGYPYNRDVPVDCRNQTSDEFRQYLGKAPAGCVAVAMGQIMRYYQYPEYYLGRRIAWDLMSKLGIGLPDDNNSTSGDGVKGNLMYYIGKACNMQYSCNGSGATNSNTISAYNIMGYPVYNNTDVAYDLTLVKMYLAAKSPVHITGFDIYGYNGHAWIVDGYLYRRRSWIGSMVLYDNFIPIYGYYTSGTNYEEYLWCNFGWGGKADGLYVSGIFNTNRQDLGNNNGLPSNPILVSDLKIIPYLH